MKKVIAFAIGASLLVAPYAASAQSVAVAPSSSTYSALVTLYTEIIHLLQQEIALLQSEEQHIQQVNAPASVTLMQGGTAEIRNESAYFSLQSLSASSATIEVTPVGCWNSFPSDTLPEVRCMIAVMPIAPQTLSVGQTYSSTKYSITLTSISGGEATFSISAATAAGLGDRCGGNMLNAPVCATGLHCAPTPGSSLPFGDVGGMCVKD